MNIFTGADVCAALVNSLREANDDDSRRDVAGIIRRIAQTEAGRNALNGAGVRTALQRFTLDVTVRAEQDLTGPYARDGPYSGSAKIVSAGAAMPSTATRGA